MIDTHCHLNDREKFPDVGSEIAFARENGVDKMIVVGVKPEEWPYTLELTQSHPGLFCILGWHPNYTANYDRSALDQLKTLAEDPRCLAIGEIGLDYHWDYALPHIQKQALLEQLDLAEMLDLPVVFHAREAYSDLLDVLEARAPRPYLLHCFAGTVGDAERAVNLGCYFGVDGPITYKKSEDLRQMVRMLPQDRLVIETDAPYLSPTPFRGKQNRPGYVTYVNQGLAQALEIPEQECSELTTKNALRFFRLN